MYTKDEIGKALANRESLREEYNQLQYSAILVAASKDASYKRLGFLWTINKTEYDIMVEECCFMYGSYLHFHQWLFANGYISERECDGIRKHIQYYSTEEKEVKHLFNGGRDCYLNPQQAEFVNYYKNIDLEGE